MFILIPKIKAQEYYSSYGPFSEWQEDAIENNDYLVEKAVFNKYAREIRNNGGYSLDDGNQIDYPLIDYNDYQIMPYTNWNKNIPSLINGRMIEDRKVYQYRQIDQIRYVYIYNVMGSYTAFRIPELNIISNNQIINYTTDCTNCNATFATSINDGLINENDSYIYNGGMVKIDLGGYYNLYDIRIDMYLYDVGNTTKTFDITLTHDDSLNQKYGFKHREEYFTNAVNKTPTLFQYHIDSTWLDNYQWGEEKTSFTEIQANWYTSVNSYNEYRYQDKKYLHYNLELEYYDDNYYLDSPNDQYNKVLNDSKVYYRFKKRDSIIINDPLVLTSKDDNILDLINTNIDKSLITIEHNIDYNHNGLYDITFNTPLGLEVHQKIRIDFLDNTLNDQIEKLLVENEELLKKLNDHSELINLKQINNELTNKLNDKDLELTDKQKLIQDLNSNILELKALNSDIINEYYHYENETKALTANYEQIIHNKDNQLINQTSIESDQCKEQNFKSQTEPPIVKNEPVKKQSIIFLWTDYFCNFC